MARNYIPKLTPLLKPSIGGSYFGTFDIESANWIDFLIMGFAFKKPEGEFIYKEFYKSKNPIIDFVEFVFQEFPSIDLYAHYGGIFDFLFIFQELIEENERYYIDKMIPRGSGLLCFEVSQLLKTRDQEIIENINKKDIISLKKGTLLYKGRKINLHDSSAILPFGFGSLAENFNVEHKKLDADRTSFSKVTDELRLYLKHDCLGLYEVIEKYHSWPLIKKAGSASTMASQSLKVFRTFLKKPIKALSKEQDAFVRESYFGGRCEIFKPLFIANKKHKKIRCYDVNSLYPAILRNNEYPTNFKGWTTQYSPNELGFYRATVEVPLDMKIPPLPTMGIIKKSEKSKKSGKILTHQSSKLIFPVGRFSGVWSTKELEYAKSLGVKIINVTDGILFHNGGYLFKEFIDTLYDMRKKAPKKSVDNILCKLLMNSCYGRFGLKRERETLMVDDYVSTGVRDPIEIPLKDGRMFRLVKKDIVLDKSFSNVAIAAWTTSLARIHIHKIYMQHPEEIYYTDTDSIYTTALYSNSNELGDLKLEFERDKACFLLPKTYITEAHEKAMEKLLSNDSKTLTDRKIVMKGFRYSETSNFSFDDFVSALEGDLRRLSVDTDARMARFKSGLNKGKILMMMEKSSKSIQSIYDKRLIFKDNLGNYDTRPLKMIDNEVILSNLEFSQEKDDKKRDMYERINYYVQTGI